MMAPIAIPENLAIIENLTKRFEGMQEPALNNLCATIFSNAITGIVGPDGAGKTTLLRLLVGLLRPDEGSVCVGAFDTQSHLKEIHALIGYMPQKFGLYEDLTVIENIQLHADLRAVIGLEREEKIKTLLEFAGLEPFRKRLAGNLSGGMKQKLGLACALIGDPKLLVLDEPSVGVDPISRRELWKMVEKLATQGRGIVWSTSYLDEAERCNTVILLNEGKVLHNGPPNDMLKKVEGRVWQVSGIAENRRRAVLIEMLQKKDVLDGIIQGRTIRILQGPKLDKQLLTYGKWLKTSPCFEDAFIDELGGGPGSYSSLASEMEEKPPNDKPVIDAQGLSKKFGDFVAVNQNSFQVKRGEIFGLLGPNGAGKSTLFKMMCGLLQPTQGRAFIMGLDLKTASSQARSRIGYMAQKFSLYGNLNVLQNLKFFSGLYGLSGKKQQQQIDLMITIFHLHNHLKMNAAQLPLGFKQRLGLACAVMHQPDVLFLDEPTSGVDPITRREFWMHINAMIEKGVTVMVTTHFMDEAEYCDRIGLIYHGDNIATGTPDDLKEMVKSKELKNPTLEDAFIALVHQNEISLSARGLA
jgi:ABC-2 type transport system ATP-binding protein